MSFLLMARAIKADIPDCYAKWLLVVLADHANEETGQCWPSLERLADRTQMNKATVARKLNWLEEHGLVVRERGNSRRSTLYTVFPTVAQCDTTVAESDTNLSITSNNNKVVRRKQVPDEWMPSDDLRFSIDTIMKEEFDHDFEANQFRDHHQSKGTTFIDIEKAYRNWIRNSVKFGTAKTIGGSIVRDRRPSQSGQKSSYFGRINTRLHSQ